MTRWPVICFAVPALAAVALLAAGCGGSSSPSVAALGTTTSGTTTPAGSASSGSASSGGGLSLKTQNGFQFSACMRSHGIANFPDPNSQGAIQVGPGSGIDPRSPKFQAAQKACQKVLPNGGQPTPQQLAQMQRKALAYSACMRKHGLPDFPDPTFSSAGGIGIRIRLGGPNSDLNPSSPVFQAAQKACGGIIGKPGG
jgi:hypothetical protein